MVDHSLIQRDCSVKARVNAAIEGNRDHFDCLDLQLGYTYGKRRDSTKTARIYVPRTEVGAKDATCLDWEFFGYVQS